MLVELYYTTTQTHSKILAKLMKCFMQRILSTTSLRNPLILHSKLIVSANLDNSVLHHLRINLRKKACNIFASP